MKSTQITLVCIILLCLFSLHQCGRMESRDTGKSSKIYTPKCFKANCHGFPLVKNCWCCFNDEDICWHDREICMRLC
ncbi:hypothetical protein Bca4012_029849 [Brassica carinata]|uniref:Embryo surrounding factor 1 brassicaceae domain-containing protein n=1 Tax=Brassica oleracea var. oleracea TaxID=109376 RepID=A0A0D3BSZ0_BRAOL